MKYSVHLFIWGIFIILLEISLMKGQDGKGVCRLMLSTIFRRQLRSLTGCIKEMRYKSLRERQKGSNCIVKCALMREGLLNRKGLGDEELIQKYVEKVPDFMQNKTEEFITECQAYSENLNPMEKDCKTYEPLAKCAMKALRTFCYY